jgi:hypothetical protein
VDACVGTDSLDGDIAIVATITINGASGTDTAIYYDAHGTRRVKETFSIGARDANGLIPLTGSGTCTGGTGVHEHEKCHYTFTQSVNLQTGLSYGMETGTTTQ